MSKLQLGSIYINEAELPLNTFVIGDVVDGGGYNDPALVNDELELYRKFRYSKNYEAYRKLILAGATLALAGNLEDLNDIPTCTIFQDGKIKSANPRYEDLFKNTDVLMKEIFNSSYIIESEEQLRGTGDNPITGYKKSLQFTYRIYIKPKHEHISLDIIEGINAERTYTLVLPTKPDPSETQESHNYGILFQNSSNYPTSTNIEYGYSGLIGNLGKIKIREEDSNLEVLRKILGATVIINNEEINLKEFYYDNGEYFDIVGTHEDCYLVLETPYPIKYIDFCSQYCDIFDFICDYEWTQKIYYIRGLMNQGLVLSCYSNFANREGRGISLRYSCINSWMNLTVTLGDESYEYVGRELLKDTLQCPLVTFTDINYVVNGTEPSTVPLGFFETNSFVNAKYDIDTLYRAYESFIEYDIHPSVIISTHMVEEWRRSSLINLFRKLTKDYLQGGLFSTLCIQVSEDEAGYISTVTPSIGSDKVFWFSGEFNTPAVYQYLIKWLTDKCFSPDAGVAYIPGTDLANTFSYNGFEILYEEDNDYILSLALSHIINAIYNVIYPGILPAIVSNRIQEVATEVVDFNPILDSVEIVSISIEQNTVIINLNIYYKRVQDIIVINFKIYKYYGTGIA